MANFTPRPGQAEVFAYTRGKMGVAAVPGSGKTWTLSLLASKLVAEQVDEDEEVLIVTLVNSAVDNFTQRVSGFIKERGLLPNVGYRVRTLHGLCNDIVRQKAGLLGLDDNFQIIDEREANGILQDAALNWYRANAGVIDNFLALDTITEGKLDWLRKEQVPPLVNTMAAVFIKQAKDRELTPEDLRFLLDDYERTYGETLPLAEMGYDIYVGYQRGLNYRGALDFQDLIRLALKALELDETYLERLRRTWRYILEDEAQDSSQLQEKILRTLTGADGNWVRVGDPNQAIYETFTTARPEYLWDFLDEPDVERRELPNSGRSAEPIIDLANFLIEWVMRNHPSREVRERSPLQTPFIKPTPPGDPQPNPPADESQVFSYDKSLSPADEIRAVVESIQRWLPDNQDQTVAVLVPRNKRGFDVVDALKQVDVEYVELLRSTATTRETAGALGNILRYLSLPNNAGLLATVYRVWRRLDRDDEVLAARLDAVAKLLRRCPAVEDYIAPQLGRDWLAEDEAVAELAENIPDLRDDLATFRSVIKRWQEAVVLPIDQLLLLLGQELFVSAADLAITHSLAVALRRYEQTNPDWRLPRFTEELATIARNERRFLGMDDDERAFDPDSHRGKVTVATMHSAKGLEWDRVYLMSVNNYDFPSVLPGDRYMSEKWFVSDELNMEAETLAQLEAAQTQRTYQPGAATHDARVDYASERLRLLYVGITRARRELVITWNTGRKGDQTAAAPFVAMQNYWAERTAETESES